MVERLKAADWLVLPIPHHAEAVAFMCEHHYARGAPNTSTYRHGLYRAADWPMATEPWGVALWIPPTRAAAETVAGEDWGGVLALSRFAIHPDVPPNGASFLLGRSMKMIDRERWPWLLTYADTGEGHTGAIYRATGWDCRGSVAAGDTWVDEAGVMRGRKRGGRTMTAIEMTQAGLTRRPNLPKIKFVHPPPRRVRIHPSR